jgi:integrase
MLSGTLKPMDGWRIGEHPVVIKLLKGCYNLNPPRPKYNKTWDPAQVLSFLSSLGDNNELSLSVLARKMVTLIALATLMRVSEISAIVYKSVVFNNGGVRFSLESPRKTQKSGPLQTFSLAACADSKIFTAGAVKSYLEMTESLRTDVNMDRLVIAVIPPHKPVSPNTTSRWIKSVLKSAGVNTDEYGAHSTRSAAASKASASGLSIDAILKAGSWAQESTFRKFYNRPSEPTVESAVFGQTHN